MSKTKFVYLNDNKVLTIFILDDKDIKHAAFIAGIKSNAKLFEINPNIPAGLGWKYDGENCVAPDGTIWKA